MNGTMERVWSPYQVQIFEFIESSRGSLLVEAVAGSGKTTTIVEAIRHVPSNQSVAFLAFNKSIAEELKRRVTQPNAKCMTLHAAGFNAWRQFLSWDAGNLQVDSRKTSKMIDALCDRDEIDKEMIYTLGGEMGKLVGYAKSAGIVPKYAGLEAFRGLSLNCLEVWEEMVEFYGLDEDKWDSDALNIAEQVLAESILQSRDMIDFDDMLYMPVISGATFEKFDVVFLDEAQDVSGIQVEMVDRMRHAVAYGALSGNLRSSRVVAVGDRHQCQPAGTLVRTPDGRSVRIETLKDGDRVVAVDISHSCFKAGGETVKVSKRNYLGPLVEVYSEGKHSAYTPNHKCIANPKPLCSKYVVYLMQRGENFRIGSTQFGVVAGSGIRTRLMTEKADNLWVLTVHESRAEARFQEAILSNVHGIPERTFVSQDKSGKGLGQKLLDRFWSSIPSQAYKALNLLTLFNRKVEFPLVSKQTARKFSCRRPSQIQACNLLTGMLVLHDQPTIHYKKHQWKPISQILCYNFDGEVYSLDVAGAHTYIADGIATHNSIYGFRGALSNSMDNIKERFDAEELPLSVSYRCPKLVVEHAQSWVPQIESFEGAAPGAVSYPESWNVKDFHAGDAVLCRVSRPTVELAFRLIRAKVPAKVLGRDIGQGLIKLVDKMKALDLVDLDQKLTQYRAREAKKSSMTLEKLAALDDKLDTIRVFMDEAGLEDGTLGGLKAAIESLFGESADGARMVTLSTVHKAKGLEWPRVFILDADLYMPSKWARQPWARQQEANLQYVAATRAQRELVYVSSLGMIEER